LGSMFLDGMGDQLSRLEKKDDTGKSDHAECDPLDGIEQACLWVWLTEEGQEELGGAGGGKGEREDVARMIAELEVAEEEDGEDGGHSCRVESNRMETDGVRWDAKAPGEAGGEACIAAFCKVSEGKKGPGECRAGRPGVEGVEERKFAKTEVDHRRESGEENAGYVERRDHQKKDGVLKKILRIGDDQQETGEREGGEEGDETGVPELVRVEAHDRGGAEAEGESSHESQGGEDAEGGKQKMSGVEKVGVHGEL
jgi:hypothetical protein